MKTASRGAIGIEALTAGSIDFAASGHIPFMALAARGAPRGGRGDRARDVSQAHRRQPSQRPEGAGRPRATHLGMQVGTGVHTVVSMILERKGLSEQDLGITNLRVVDMPAAMAWAASDGVIGWEPMMQRILQGGHGVHDLGEHEFNQSAEVTFPFLLTTRQDYRDKNPKVVQGVVNSYAKAHHFIRTNKERR